MKKRLPVFAIVFITIFTLSVNMARALARHNFDPDFIDISLSLLFAATWLASAWYYGSKIKYKYLIISSAYFLALTALSIIGMSLPADILLHYPLMGITFSISGLQMLLSKPLPIRVVFLYVAGVLIVLNAIVFIVARKSVSDKNRNNSKD